MRLPPTLRVPEMNRAPIKRISELERRRIRTAAQFLNEQPPSETGLTGVVRIQSTTLSSLVANSPLDAAVFIDFAIDTLSTGDFIELGAGFAGQVTITQPGIYTVSGKIDLTGLDQYGCTMGIGIFMDPGNVYAPPGWGGGYYDPSGGIPTGGSQLVSGSYTGVVDHLFAEIGVNTLPIGGVQGPADCDLWFQQLAAI